jgi:FtsP/CotA-like multicopper oxidase with cupredoxin domain
MKTASAGWASSSSTPGLRASPNGRRLPFRWDYRRFAKPDTTTAPPDETIALAIAAHIGARDGFDEFTINGTPFSMRAMQPRFRLDHGKRYRLHLCNATDDTHPIHLHRHGTMLLIPDAINTATILSTRVQPRQSAFRSLIPPSQ